MDLLHTGLKQAENGVKWYISVTSKKQCDAVFT